MKIAILGLGYVGLPLAINISKNFKTIGFDLNNKRITQLRNFIDNNKQLSKNDLRNNKNLLISNNSDMLKKSDIFIITVPTPIKDKKPDLTLLRKACEIVAKYISRNSLIILESTVYPGITENYCANIISKKSKLKYKIDFQMGYSPERINPGDKKKTIDKITKVISASNNQSIKAMKKIYGSFLKAKIFEASSIQVAEAAKVIENTQRDINIAFMNEIKEIFDSSNLNIYEILKAAKTKWNFLDFEPGLVGGHCIGVDPYYLAEYSKKQKIKPKIILSGRQINDRASKLLTIRIIKKLKKINKPKILILGCTFKENCPDIRNSKIIDIALDLNKRSEFEVNIYDPWIVNEDIKNLKLKFLKFLDEKVKYDLILVAVKHTQFYDLSYNKLKTILRNDDTFIIDYKNMFEKYE